MRKPDAGHAPAMRLPAKRLSDFSQACDAICRSKNLEDLLVTLLNIGLKQFGAFHTWCALREQPSGPMTYHAGKRRDGQAVDLSEIKLADKINQAVERSQSLVMPRVGADVEEKARIRSALIAAIAGPTRLLRRHLRRQCHDPRPLHAGRLGLPHARRRPHRRGAEQVPDVRSAPSHAARMPAAGCSLLSDSQRRTGNPAPAGLDFLLRAPSRDRVMVILYLSVSL